MKTHIGSVNNYSMIRSAALNESPGPAMVVAWKVVSREVVATARNAGVSGRSFVQRVRQLRDQDYIDRSFANDLEKLRRVIKNAEALEAAGVEIARRSAKEYAQLAIHASRRLHSLRRAA